MTPQEAQIIRDAIDADPSLSSQPQTPDGAFAIAEALNSPTEPGFKAITVASAMLWAASGPRVRIAAASTNLSEPEGIRASCQVFLDLIVSGSDALVHTEEGPIRAMFDSWLAASVITQAEHDAVYGTGGLAETLLPKSVVLIGRTVGWQDVVEARAV
jgi:hypothetical protein